MASKGKGKGKLFTALPPSAAAAIGSTKQHEGAMDNAYYVLAQMKNGEWRKAKIIECLLSKDYDSKKKKNEYSYDYYVHYEGFDRRMDNWIPRSWIQPVNTKLKNNRLMN